MHADHPEAIIKSQQQQDEERKIQTQLDLGGLPVMDSLQTLNIKRLTDGDTNSYSGTASSIDSTGSTSYTGGAAAGWVIKIPNGPIIYHTGDTNIFADIRLVNQVYKPTHTVLPVGELCTLKAFDAAYVCKNFLTNCQTVIPINFKVCESQNQVLETKHMNED